MKKFIKFNIIALVLLCSSAAFSQQLPQFTQYMFNTISINPAYAGSRETLSLVGLHRSQWIGLDGGPTTQTFSIHSPLRNEKVGLGLSFIHDELGFENFSYIYGDFSYTIHVSEKTKLAFGLKGGFTSYSVDQELRDAYPTDPAIRGIENRWSPNIGAGAFLHTNRWYVGLSAPRILNTDYNGTEDYEALERISYYLTGGVVVDVSENTKFKPSFMVKATNGAPLSYDITGNFLFYDKLWLGAAYRFDESAGAFGGIVDFQVSKEFRIGYAYEHPISDIRPYSSGTHEILLMFEVFKSKRVKSPRYF
ncbi:MAG: type IX secretion system membrane protein PorP/SprF [Flavobacteriaceae bacterium]